MAQFKDGNPKGRSVNDRGWIYDLAKAELIPGRDPSEPQQILEEATIDFLNELRALYTDSVRSFNTLSENGQRFAEIKIYSVAQTATDFMMFRNQAKLVIIHVAPGVIQLSYSSHSPTAVAIDGVGAGSNQILEISAQMGPFRNIFWTFKGERVTIDEVARHSFVEFVRYSRDARKAKDTNQVILEQIKQLLQEKGIDLKIP